MKVKTKILLFFFAPLMGFLFGFLSQAQVPPEIEKRLGSQDPALAAVQTRKIREPRVEQAFLRMLNSHRFWHTLYVATQLTLIPEGKTATTFVEKFWLQQPYWARHEIYVPGKEQALHIMVITPSSRMFHTSEGITENDVARGPDDIQQELAMLPKTLYQLPPLISIDHPLRRALLSHTADYLFPAPFAQRTDTRHQFVFLGEGAFLNRPVWKIQILFEPDSPQSAQWTLWVDQQTGIVLKAESGPYPGTPTEYFQVLQFQHNPVLSRNIFAWEGRP